MSEVAAATGRSAMTKAFWRILPLIGLAYALFEIPSKLMLVRFGVRKWIARIMITGGLSSAAMTLAETPMHHNGIADLMVRQHKLGDLS